MFKAQPYDELPLKIRDINVDLPAHDSIDQTVNFISKIPGIFAVTIIDKFVSDNLTKVTLRISGNDEAIAKIDENFNQ